MLGENPWIVVTVVVVVLAAMGIGRLRRRLSEHRDLEQEGRRQSLKELPAIPMAERDDDAIYQFSRFFGERRVARVVEAEVDEKSREVRFLELTHSDGLLLPDECEFRKFKLQIHTVEDAIKADRNEPEKGRILRNVGAEIVGYVEH